MAEEQSPNEAAFRKILEQVKNNDSSLTSINLNNLQEAKPEWTLELIDALQNNTHVQTLLIANCNVGNEGAKRLSELIKTSTVLQEINLETNKIGGEGTIALAAAIEVSTSLREIKLTNQSQLPGNEAEKQLANALDKNTTVQKCTITMRDASSRNVMDRAITRNREIARKARQAAKK